MSTNYDQLMIEWAHNYNGYRRLAGGPRNLDEILAPLRHEFDQDRRIPEWAGIDLLRGWAFYLVRAHRHSGGYEPFTVEYPEVFAIADAIDKHPAVTDADRPPARLTSDRHGGRT